MTAELVWGIGLGLLPVIHFIAIYAASVVKRTLPILKRIHAIMYMDWLFVPFNILAPFIVQPSTLLVVVSLLFSIAAVAGIHIAWGKARKNIPIREYFIVGGKLTAEGTIHGLFMILQATIVLSVFFSKAQSVLYVVALLCLLVYLISYVIVVRVVRGHSLLKYKEGPFVLLSTVAVIARFALL